MIKYEIEIEEMPDGSLRVHRFSKPGLVTVKEKKFAEMLIQILKTICDSIGSSIQIGEN